MRRILFAVLFVFLIGFTSAAVNLSFSPSSQQVGNGTNFGVNVSVSNVTDLYSFQFDLTYNSSVLQYIGISSGPFLNSDGASIFQVPPNSSSPGVLRNYAATRIGVTNGVSGNGVIAQLIFRGLNFGNSNFVLSNDSLYDSNSTNPQLIVHNTLIGNVTIINCDVDGDTFLSLTCGGTDCNDNNILEKPGQTWWNDFDRDRYGNGTNSVQCLRPLSYNVSTELIATTGDCNNNNAAINPGATEICDGIDNNCVGGVDEGVTITYYRDLDVDTFGNLTNTIQACSLPGGYTLNNTDCNDNNILEKPGQTWWNDFDRDRYGNGTNSVQCLRPLSYNVSTELIATTGDCNNNNAAINPGAAENASFLTCTDGLDNNCNVLVDMAESSCILSTYDINNDGFVNVGDLSAAALSFGSSCTGPSWCTRRDVNQNGAVNIQDLSLVGLHFY
ncbi:MAG: MopE-related protein [Nanoarchaeota archaeon]